MAIASNTIQQLYIAYYGRPADPVGLAYWAAKDVADVTLNFGNQTESINLYAGMGTAQKINYVYNQLFGRDAEPAGLLYWVGQINNSSTTGVTLTNAAWIIMNGAQNTDLYKDIDASTNKLSAANAFTLAIDTTSEIVAYDNITTNSAIRGSARAWLATVGATAASVTAATATIATTLSGIVTASVPPVVSTGQTFTLTTGTDVLPGSSGDDIFLGTAATTLGTFNAADVLNGGAGNDILNLTIDVLAANSVSGATSTGIETINFRGVSGNAQTIVGGNFAGATAFVSDRSTDAMTITGLVAGQSLGIVGNGSVLNGTMADTYGATVTAATLNVSNGTTGGAITQTAAGNGTQTINSTGAANTIGAFAMGGAVTALNINATTTLTTGNITGFTGTAAKITVSGAAASATTNVGVTLGTIENATVATIDASGLTVGGLSATLSTNTAIVVTGGTGNDRITTGAVLTTGSVNAGAGTADRLNIAADVDVASLSLGNKYSGFEVIGIAAAGTQDLDLLATNNTLTGLRLAGTGTVTNINAATAANVTILGASTPSLGVKGALTPGQIDTVSITVSDETAGITVKVLTAPVLTGVEIVNLVATDSITISTLANALSVTNLNISGAGAVIVTTLGAVALQTNYAINAGTATGNLTIDGTGATTNGFSVVGSSGINTITGGSQIFAANVTASAAKADVIALTNATGGTIALPNASITGFTNSATVPVGDHLELAGVAVLGRGGVAVAATATATVATMTEAISATGIITFAGAGATTATLANKINAALETGFLGDTVLHTGAFEHGGNTYIVNNADVTIGFQAATDYVVCLVGVTGVTALSTTASGGTTVWVS